MGLSGMLPTAICKEHFICGPAGGCLLRTGKRTREQSAKPKHPDTRGDVIPRCRHSCLLALRLERWAVVESVGGGSLRFPTVRAL
eukprot:4703651-Amphidinium_carterae.1